MKLAGPLGFFPALFALVLLFSGCDALPFGNDNNNNNNNTPAANNGSIFYKQAPDGKFVIISVFSSPGTGKAVEPKAGNRYALAIVPVSNGSLNYSGQIDSEGVLTAAADNKFNFVSDNSSQEAGVGSFSGGKLTMEKVPGFPNYKNLSLDWLKDDVITAAAPFPNVNIPNTGNNGDDDNSGGTDVSRDPVFRPGSYVTGVKFKALPTFPQTAFYEGTKVRINADVEITYRDGSTKSMPVDENNFIICPPYYVKPGHSHKLIYIGEYNDPNEIFETFTGPKTTTAPITTFYKLGSTSADITISGIETIRYFEGYGFDFGDLKIKGKHVALDSDGTAVTTAATTAAIDLCNYATINQNGTNTTINLIFGDGNNGKKEDISFASSFELSKISISGAAFTDQITFDDPRLFLEDGVANKYWLSHLSDAKIGLGYGETTTQQEIRVVEAAMGLVPGTKFELTPPTTDWANKKLKFEYGKTSKTKDNYLDIQLYDTLAGIAVESKNGKRIVLNGATPDNEASFLKLVNVYAIYQIENNKNNTVRKPVYVGDKFATFNSLCINGNSDTNIAGILNSSSSNSYNKNGKLQKATVTLTSYNGYVKISDKKDATPQSMTGTISVGVTGY